MLGYSLVALAMVIGANIEYGMIFAVVPADVFGIGFDKGETFVLSPRPCVSIWANSQLRDTTAWAFRNLKRKWRSSRGDDAYQIVFGGKNIDSGDFAFVHQLVSVSHKTLVFCRSQWKLI